VQSNNKDRLNGLSNKTHMNNAILRLSSVSKSFDHNQQSTTILNNISVTFEQQNSYAIVGASGVGKSTLLHIIAGLDTPTSGAVFFNNTALNAMSSVAFSSFLNSSIGLMFQSAHLIKELSVLENVMLPGLIAQTPLAILKQRALQLLNHVGLSDHIQGVPAALSGGQQQRVSLARALINQPAFLIADEPTGNLDITTGKAVIELLLASQQQWGMGLIISSHDPLVAQAMNNIFELTNGTIAYHKVSPACYPQKKFLQKQFK